VIGAFFVSMVYVKFIIWTLLVLYNVLGLIYVVGLILMDNNTHMISRSIDFDENIIVDTEAIKE